MEKKDVLEVCLNMLLHVFLLSFFVVIFYYVRAVPMERNGFLSFTRPVPSLVSEGVMQEVKANAQLRRVVCALSPSKYASQYVDVVKSALRSEASGQDSERKRHNSKLETVALGVSLGVLACAGGLFLTGVGKENAADIIKWNVATFVVFTAFELLFFTFIASKFRAFTPEEERSAFMEAAGLDTTACK
jgi:hypothetical protein